MTKRKYLQRLRKALGNIPTHEKEELIEYYNELIEESLDRGKTEKEIFEEMDTPEQAARNYLREGAPNATVAVRERKSKSSDLDIALLPVRIICGFVLAILGIASIGVTIGFFAASVAVGISGGVLFGISFGPLFSGHVGIAFAQFGTAFALLGLSGIFSALVTLLWKLNVFLWNLLMGRPRSTRPVKKSALVTLAVSGAILLFGSFVFVGAYGAMGFDSQRLAITDGIVTQEQVIDEPTRDFSLICDNLEVTVCRSETEELRIVYREVEELPRTYSYENGVMTLKEDSWDKVHIYFFGTSAKLSWYRGIFFSWAAQDIRHAELYLPASFEGSLGLKTDNGVLTLSDMVCSDLVMVTKNGVVELTNVTAKSVNVGTNNGVVNLTNVSASGHVDVQTDNGAIKLTNVTASYIDVSSSNGAIKLDTVETERLQAHTNNGAIKLERLKADDIELKTDNGAISGEIEGSISDYAIEARTGNGSNNLPNKTDGDKRLKVRVGNGSIKIKFTD